MKTLLDIILNWKYQLVLILLGLSVVFYSIRSELFIKTKKIQRVKILKVHEGVGKVYQQTYGSALWEPLVFGDTITEGSQIRTLEGSRAVLYFQDKSSRIELGENTFIYLDDRDNHLLIEVLYGELFVGYHSEVKKVPIYVQKSDRHFELINADAYFQVDKDQTFTMSVDHGEVKYVQMDHETTFIKNQTVRFYGQKDYSLSDPPLELTTPLNYDRYSILKGKSARVRFSWAAIPEDYKIQLFLGEKPGILKPYFNSGFKPKVNEMTPKIPEGVHYWRVVAYDPKKPSRRLYSKLNKIFVELENKIQPVFPKNKAIISQKQGIAKVHFQWNNPSDFESLFLEVSQTKDFSSLVLHQSIKNLNFFMTSFKQPGVYYWRVNGFPHKTAKLVLGYTKSFIVRSENIANPIQLVFPKQNEIITTTAMDGGEIQFKWDKIGLDNYYQVGIIGPLGGASPNKVEYETRENAIVLNALKPGTYKWNVIDVDNKKNISKNYKFKVVPTRRLDWIPNNATKDSGIVWKNSPMGTKKHKIQLLNINSKVDLTSLFRNKGMRPEYTLYSKADRINLKQIKSGAYAVKVYAIGIKDKILAETGIRYIQLNN